MSFAKKVNAEHYGETATARDVLRGDREAADALKPFHDVLVKFADRS